MAAGSSFRWAMSSNAPAKWNCNSITASAVPPWPRWSARSSTRLPAAWSKPSSSEPSRSMAEGVPLKITVVYSPGPRQVHEWQVSLAPGATADQALAASPLHDQFPELNLRQAVIGIWGRKARRDQALHDRDRIEVYRPLQVDPKVARRERFRKQGVRAAGLFATRNPPANKPY